MHRHVEGTVRTTRGAGGVQQACNDEHNNGKHNGETERENRTDVGGGGTLMEDKLHHTHVCCGPTPSVGNQMRCLALDLQTRLGEIQWICDQLSYGGSHNRNDVGAGKGIRVVIFHWTQLVATT